MAFATLSLCQLFVMVSVRSNRMLIDFKSHRFSPVFLLTFFGSLVLIAAVLFVPAFSSVFGFVSLTEYGKLGQVVLISLIPLVIFELLKIPEAIRKGAKR